MKALRALKKDSFFLLLVTFAALILRIDFLSFSTLDADEAIVGLMAKHILELNEAPVFYYGQHYMGSLEAYLAAYLFKFFGLSIYALKSVPLFFSIVFIPVMYLMGNIVGGRWGGRFTALLVAAAPTSLILWSSKARGGFAEIIFIGAIALFFSMRWLSSERPKVWLTFVIWFILGIGWWVNNQILYFIIPIGLLGLVHLLRSKQTNGAFASHTIATFFAFILGGMAYWIYNLEHDFASFGMFKGSGAGDFLEHLAGLFSKALPMIFGAVRFWSSEPIFPGATLVAYLIYGAPIVWCAWAVTVARKEVSKDRHLALSLSLGLFLSTLLIFSFSSFGYLVQAPRYLLPLYVPLFIIFGAFAARIYNVSPLIGTLYCTVAIAFNIASSYLGGRAVGGEPQVYSGERVSKDHTALINWLKNKKITHVRTNYWIGYRLAFETNEEVTFSVYQDPRQVRIKEYESIDDKTFSPFVLVPSQARRIENAFRVLGQGYKREALSGYVVLYAFSNNKIHGRKLKLDEVMASASDHREVAALAIDGKDYTRWGSASPQHPGMTFKISFKNHPNLSGFSYDLGTWPQDFPRGMEALLVAADGSRHLLFDEQALSDVFYLTDNAPKVYFRLPNLPTKEIVFTLTASHSVFDWSIAELTFYERLP